MATSVEWSHGHARQADADFTIFQSFEDIAGLDATIAAAECQRLQFLQMACEKPAKSHLCCEGIDPAGLQKSHAYAERTLPVVLRLAAQSMNFTGKHARWVHRHARHLSQEIELLAPAVKRGGIRPDNCEYPWEDGNGELHVPLDWSFTPSQLLAIPAGRTLLKLIRIAIDNLLP